MLWISTFRWVDFVHFIFRGFRYLTDVAFDWISIFRQWISYFVSGFRYLSSLISYILWISIFRQTPFEGE